MGSDGLASGLRWTHPRFQSTLPHGERLIVLFLDALRGVFQSTLPHGERPVPAVFEVTLPLKFQSTLPHGERLLGATKGDFVDEFQSTLPHGERLWSFWVTFTAINFNPRSRMGSDAHLARVCLNAARISIHAPAWGATNTTSLYDQHLAFQSTLPHGERPTTLLVGIPSNAFQSTLPHGERREKRKQKSS